MVRDLQMHAVLTHRQNEAPGVDIFEFALEGHVGVPDLQPGDHIRIAFENGLARSYSLCNPMDVTDRYVIAVKLEQTSQGGSRALHAASLGDRFIVSEPRSDFTIRPGARDVLFMVGGIGITPIITMADALHAAGRRFSLHYSCPSRKHAAFLARLHRSSYAEHVHWHFSNETGGRADIRSLLEASRHCDVYFCGSQRYVDAILSAAREIDFPKDQLFSESFGGRRVEPGGSNATFEVVLARTGATVKVESDQTITTALCKVGLILPTSCEQGVCGTCLVEVLEGVPDHRDSYLTDEERLANTVMLPCCSRAKSPRLVLNA